MILDYSNEPNVTIKESKGRKRGQRQRSRCDNRIRTHISFIGRGVLYHQPHLGSPTEPEAGIIYGHDPRKVASLQKQEKCKKIDSPLEPPEKNRIISSLQDFLTLRLLTSKTIGQYIYIALSLLQLVIICQRIYRKLIHLSRG